MHTLELHNNVSEVARLAEWIETIGEEFALDPSQVFQLNLALEEAVVNVIDYAYEGEGVMDVNVDKRDGELVFILIDSGKEFNPTEKTDPDITLSAEERQIGGLGIFLVQQIMSSVEYERKEEKNILTMHYKY